MRSKYNIFCTNILYHSNDTNYQGDNLLKAIIFTVKALCKHNIVDIHIRKNDKTYNEIMR